MLQQHDKQKENKCFHRKFDDMSRLYACDEPIKTATLTLKAHAGPDNLDWLVFDKYGWPKEFKNNGKFKACPRLGVPKQLAFL